MKRKRKVKYVSIKLPVCGSEYPLDSHGCFMMPNYTPEYLKKHGKKLFDFLMNRVPATTYSELVRCIKECEKL
jgi:hypothetical protein